MQNASAMDLIIKDYRMLPSYTLGFVLSRVLMAECVHASGRVKAWSLGN